MPAQNDSYFSLFGKLLWGGGILFVNMSLLMWLFGQFQITQWLLPESLIDNVHAEAAAHLSGHPAPHRAPPAGKRPAQQNSPQAETLPDDNAGHLILRFEKNAVELDAAQQALLEQTLRERTFAAGGRIRILTGEVQSESHILTSQTEKLRAQAVARRVFPHTRKIEIKLRQPSLESGAVAVEFLPPQES